MTEPVIVQPIPARLTSSRARSMAECRWGRGGTNVSRTNTKHAYYFSCSSHGGYIVDGSILTLEQREKIEEYVKPMMVTCVIRGDIVDLMANPWSSRSQTYRIRGGQQIIEHPIFVFEKDEDFMVLEKFTPVRCLESMRIEGYDQRLGEHFEKFHQRRLERQRRDAEKKIEIETVGMAM